MKLKLYSVWSNMQARCYNKKRDDYERYGGRGIRVCIRWRRSFTAFYKWAVFNGWQKGLQIDRKDNDGNYTPDNCRFVTLQQNLMNKRIYKNNKTGVNGVCWLKNRNKFQAKIRGKFLGYFDNLEDAKECRIQNQKEV